MCNTMGKSHVGRLPLLESKFNCNRNDCSDSISKLEGSTQLKLTDHVKCNSKFSTSELGIDSLVSKSSSIVASSLSTTLNAIGGVFNSGLPFEATVNASDVRSRHHRSSTQSPNCKDKPNFVLRRGCSSMLRLLMTSTFFLFLVITTTNGCYVYPPDVKDPCKDKECSFGAQCVPSIDGLTARCQCPQRCDSYGDSVGSKPVCGTDGHDYPTQCEMRKAACSEMKDIGVKYFGKCGEYQ